MPRERQAIKEPSVTPAVHSAPSQHHVVETTATSGKFPSRKALLLTLGLVVVGAIYFLAMNPDEPEVRQFGRTRAIQLDVQNGTGEARLAQKLTEFLRAEGFDVVELGNYKSQDIPRTMVLDRAGNMDAAKFVAASLGIDEERVVQQVDKNLFLDVTVVIGKDFASLRAFR